MRKLYCTLNTATVPEDFWAFSFELTNSHLFQQKQCQLYKTMTSLRRNYSGSVLQTVIEVIYYFLLPKFIEECNRLLPERAADWTRCKGLCAHCTCLNSASMRTVRKLKRNNGHLVTFQIWLSWRCRVKVATHEDSSEAQNSFWIKSRTGENMGQFSAGPINKAVPSFRNSLNK